MPTTLNQRPSLNPFRAVVAAILWLGVAACDDGTSDEGVAQELPCDLADEACAALPGAADALALIESMGIDLDEASVELVEVPSRTEGLDTLKDETIPQAQRASCNGNGEYLCCCYWGGPDWGCECSDDPN